MPPCPAETTVWESMKAKNFLLSTLNNTRGWVSVVGTKGAGKTQRVLSTCHTLLSTSRNKDFVWVDFNGIGRYPQSIPGLIPCQPPLSHPLSHTLSVKSNLLDVVWVDFDCDFNNGIGSDMEAISRVVYQLGLRQVCKSSMSTRTKTKIFTHHPSSVPQSLSTTPHSYSIPTSSLLFVAIRCVQSRISCRSFGPTSPRCKTGPSWSSTRSRQVRRPVKSPVKLYLPVKSHQIVPFSVKSPVNFIFALFTFSLYSFVLN